MDIYNNKKGQQGLDKYEGEDEGKGNNIRYISSLFIAPHCNVMMSYDQSCDGSNLIGTILYHNSSRGWLSHLSPPYFDNQSFESTFWINLLNQFIQSTFLLN